MSVFPRLVPYSLKLCHSIACQTFKIEMSNFFSSRELNNFVTVFFFHTETYIETLKKGNINNGQLTLFETDELEALVTSVEKSKDVLFRHSQKISTLRHDTNQWWLLLCTCMS